MEEDILIVGDPIPFAEHIQLWDKSARKISRLDFKLPYPPGLSSVPNPKMSVSFFLVPPQSDNPIGEIRAVCNPKGGTRLSIRVDDKSVAQWLGAKSEFLEELKRIGYYPFTDTSYYGEFKPPIFQDIIVAYHELINEGIEPTDIAIAKRIPHNPSTGNSYSREYVNMCRQKLRKAGFDV